MKPSQKKKKENTRKMEVKAANDKGKEKKAHVK